MIRVKLSWKYHAFVNLLPGFPVKWNNVLLRFVNKGKVIKKYVPSKPFSKGYTTVSFLSLFFYIILDFTWSNLASAASTNGREFMSCVLPDITWIDLYSCRCLLDIRDRFKILTVSSGLLWRCGCLHRINEFTLRAYRANQLRKFFVSVPYAMGFIQLWITVTIDV